VLVNCIGTSFIITLFLTKLLQYYLPFGQRKIQKRNKMLVVLQAVKNSMKPTVQMQNLKIS